MATTAPERPSPAPCPRRTRGFTLIELMVVIVILGLLMSVVVPNLFGQLTSATKDTARSQMHAIGGAIDYFVLERRALPKSLDELTQPSPKSNAPFLRSIPKDPWGGEYEYRIVSAERREYTLTTAADDRVVGTEDDIVVPDRAPR